MTRNGDALLELLPQWFREIVEYIAICRAYGFALDDLEGKIDAVRDNFFVQTCDAETLTYWERLLGLSYDAGFSTDYRRQRILVRLSQTVPYTERHLREELEELFGDEYSLEVDPQEQWVKIYVTSDRYGAVSLLRDIVHKWIPAHLIVYSNQQVTNTVSSMLYHGAYTGVIFEQTIGTGGN